MDDRRLAAGDAIRHLRELRGRWSVLRARYPGIAGLVGSTSLGLRGYLRVVAEVQTLRTRTQELERDHALLAAHVAALSERTFGGSDRAGSGAIERAQLSAIASYEHRIAALEQQLEGRRHARAVRSGAAGAGTFGERQESAR